MRTHRICCARRLWVSTVFSATRVSSATIGRSGAGHGSEDHRQCLCAIANCVPDAAVDSAAFVAGGGGGFRESASSVECTTFLLPTIRLGASRREPTSSVWGGRPVSCSGSGRRCRCGRRRRARRRCDGVEPGSSFVHDTAPHVMTAAAVTAVSPLSGQPLRSRRIAAKHALDVCSSVHGRPSRGEMLTGRPTARLTGCFLWTTAVHRRCSFGLARTRRAASTHHRPPGSPSMQAGWLVLRRRELPSPWLSMADPRAPASWTERLLWKTADHRGWRAPAPHRPDGRRRRTHYRPPSKPCSYAVATAAARSLTPSFRSTCTRCVFTVALLMNSDSAISRFRLPRHEPNTSRSRELRGSPAGSPDT